MIFVFFQIEDEQREEERKASEVELNNLESFIYKYKRDGVVKPNQPLLNRLSSILAWIEGDGQFADLAEIKSKMVKIKDNVSLPNRFIMILRYFTDLDDVTKGRRL